MSDKSGINKNWKPASLQRKLKELAYYVDGVKSADHGILAESITLMESLAVSNSFKMQLLEALQDSDQSKSTFRIGISGSPGVGKSTFIDSFGQYLTTQNHKVAVLAIDPSSELTKGSILGDKTRMNQLSINPKAFVRPTPTSNLLGGVAPVTKESILLCEAAGFDVLFVETVGVGQSETELRSIVDIFCLLLLPGAGDDLQGIKKGIVEISDLFIINKADNDLKSLAKKSQKFYKNALHLQKAEQTKWIKEVLTCSALEQIGLAEIWESMQGFNKIAKEENRFYKKRNDQDTKWVIRKKKEMITNKVASLFSDKLANKNDDENVFNELITFDKYIEQKLSDLGTDDKK